MSATSLTSELEALNAILAAVGEAPVQSAAVTGLYPLEAAKASLNEASRVVQSMAWSFNVDDPVTVPLAPGGTAAVPADALRFTPDPAASTALHRPTMRGTVFYNAAVGSYVFTSPIVGACTRLLPWDYLPEPARRYIIVRACQAMQGKFSVPDGLRTVTLRDVQEAHQILVDFEAENNTANWNMVSDNADANAILAGRWSL